jgi:peptide/nickel transport system permease protein
MALPQVASGSGPAPVAEGGVPALRGDERRWGAAGVLWGILRQSRKAMVGFWILVAFGLVAVVGPLVAPYDPNKIGVGMPSLAPSWQHWLGTTRLSQDIFSQLLAGTRASLLLAVSVGLLATFLAMSVGMTAGYIGGWVDDLLSLIANVFLIIPSLPLLIVFSTYAMSFNLHGWWIMAVAITITSWPWGARAMRSQMLSMRSKDFVLAARVTGESWVHVIWAEILPNMLSIVAANFIFSCLAAVVAEAGLEFIGLGDTSRATWGTILYWAQGDAALLQREWWWFMPPGLCIGIFSTGLVLMNYAIDEITNPRLRVQRQRKGARPALAAGADTQSERKILDRATTT